MNSIRLHELATAKGRDLCQRPERYVDQPTTEQAERLAEACMPRLQAVVYSIAPRTSRSVVTIHNLEPEHAPYQTDYFVTPLFMLPELPEPEQEQSVTPAKVVAMEVMSHTVTNVMRPRVSIKSLPVDLFPGSPQSRAPVWLEAGAKQWVLQVDMLTVARVTEDLRGTFHVAYVKHVDTINGAGYPTLKAAQVEAAHQVLTGLKNRAIQIQREQDQISKLLRG